MLTMGLNGLSQVEKLKKENLPATQGKNITSFMSFCHFQLSNLYVTGYSFTLVDHPQQSLFGYVLSDKDNYLYTVLDIY